jgi:uncharacterized protein (TIGR03067 family)
MDPGKQAGPEKKQSAEEEFVEKEKTKLEGAWVAVAFEQSGKKAEGARARLLEGMSWEFKGDEFTWRMEGKIEMTGSFKINAAKTPKEIDLLDSKRKATCVGIYEIEGETLRIRFHLDKDARPEAFTTKEGARGHILVVLNRTKK